MTTDNIISDDNSGTLELLPPAQPVHSTAIAMLHEHAEAMSVAYKLAEAMVKTEMVPARYRNKADDATAAILYGAELGLNPIQSLQNVFAVNGSPSIYARTMVALLRRQGYRFKTVEKTREAVEIHGDDPRTGDHEEARWTIQDATDAGYTSNKKYQSDPKAMLYAKAAAEVCRHLAPDVLLGIAYTVEEMESEEPTRVVSERERPAHRARGAAALAEAASSAQPVDAETVPETEGTSGEAGADGNWTKDARRKGLNRMHQLFTEGDLTKENREDRLVVTGAIIGRTVESSNDLTDAEIAQVNGKLDAASREGSLGQQITDILNNAALAEAGLDERDDS